MLPRYFVGADTEPAREFPRPRELRLRTAAGGTALVLGTSHIDGDAAARVRAAILRHRPLAVVVELDAERWPTADAARVVYPTPSARLGPKAAAFRAATARCAANAAALTGLVVGDDVAAAAAAARAVGAAVLLADRPLATTFARWAADPVAPITWRDTLCRALPAAITRLALPPAFEPSFAALAPTLLHTAARDWPALAADLRRLCLAGGEADALFAASPAGHACADWNALVVSLVKRGAGSDAAAADAGVDGECGAGAAGGVAAATTGGRTDPRMPASTLGSTPASRAAWRAALRGAWLGMARTEAQAPPERTAFGGAPPLALGGERDALLASAIRHADAAVTAAVAAADASAAGGATLRARSGEGSEVAVVAVVGESHLDGIASQWAVAPPPAELLRSGALLRPHDRSPLARAAPPAAAAAGAGAAWWLARRAPPRARAVAAAAVAAVAVAAATLADGVRALDRRLDVAG